jgi:hypothetical protein
VILLVSIGGVLGAFSGVSRATTLPTLISLIAALITVQLIESVPGNEAAALSYYSQKAVMGIVMTNVWILFIPFIPVLVLRADQWRNFSITRRLSQVLLEVVAVVALPLLLVSMLSPLPNTMGEVWKGWVNPDAVTVPYILEEWDSEDDYIFWRFTEDPDRFIFPAPFADRVANLWSPTTWDHRSYRGMGAIWNWMYFEVNGDNPYLLCIPIIDYPLRIITRDPLLEEQVLKACGENGTIFDVRPRLAVPEELIAG